MKKHRMTFTDEEMAILEERLEIVEPMKYDLHTYAVLRNLYGRIVHLRALAEGKGKYA